LGNRIRPDKKVPVRCAADPGQLKSKSRAAWDRGAEFVIQPPEQPRAHPFQPTPVASHLSSLPGSAIPPRGTARTVRSAVRRAHRNLTQRRVKNFLRFPRVAQHEETKAIKLWQILFSFRHARWSPKNFAHSTRLG